MQLQIKLCHLFNRTLCVDMSMYWLRVQVVSHVHDKCKVIVFPMGLLLKCFITFNMYLFLFFR